MKCPACGRGDSIAECMWGGMPLKQCLGCGHRWEGPRPSKVRVRKGSR